jgi:hypothetical protein
MNAQQIVRSLLTAAREPADRKDARAAWVRETAAKWRDAMRQMDDRCMEAVERLDEEAFDRLCDAEEAKVEAIRAQLQAVIDKDRWPKELYFGGI